MKAIFSLFLICQAFTLRDPSFIGKVAAGSGAAAPTYLLSENFDGTGTPAGWTIGAGSVVDFDYATSPAPLEGTQSVLVGIIECYASFTAQSDCWFYLRANWSALNTRFVFSLRDNTTAGGVKQVSVRLINDGSLTIYDTSQTVSGNSGAGSISAATTYHIWVHAIKGTGANEDGELYFSTTGTKPGSPNASFTTGTGTANFAQLGLEGWNDGNYIYDMVRVDDVSIGSNPP